VAQSKSKLEEMMALQLRAAKLPASVREHVFCPGRLFRFDFAWPERKFALEVHGGEWTRGRHTRGGGMTDDCIKAAEALKLGWRVLTVTGTMVRDGTALQYVEQLLGPQ
jgi:hypothetical protein